MRSSGSAVDHSSSRVLGTQKGSVALAERRHNVHSERVVLFWRIDEALNRSVTNVRLSHQLCVAACGDTEHRGDVIMNAPQGLLGGFSGNAPARNRPRVEDGGDRALWLYQAVAPPSTG